MVLLIALVSACGAMREERQKNVDMHVRATCGNCDICEIVLDGDGVETTKGTEVNIDEPSQDF